MCRSLTWSGVPYFGSQHSGGMYSGVPYGYAFHSPFSPALIPKSAIFAVSCGGPGPLPGGGGDSCKKTVCFGVFSLCLSRACLGQVAVFTFKMAQKEAFFAP
jgi:hypothetical protein